MDDLSTTSATVTSGIIDTDAGIDPDGKFSEAIRLTERDNVKYSFGSETFDGGFTLECFFKPNLSTNAPQAHSYLKQEMEQCKIISRYDMKAIVPLGIDSQ